jgi:outer membrane translocation and assembly module TamA
VDRLGTLDSFTENGFPEGGNAQVLLNSEIRVALFGPVAGVAFLDLGNVFERTAHVALDGLRPGAGGGLHYNSGIVGTVRFEVGANLDRRELTPGRLERGYIFHVSLGRAF